MYQTAFGTVTACGDTQGGLILLQPAPAEWLAIGMAALQKFHKALIVCHNPRVIRLVDATQMCCQAGVGGSSFSGSSSL